LPGQYHTQPVAKTADDRQSAADRAFHPQPARESGETEHEYRQLKGKRDL